MSLGLAYWIVMLVWVVFNAWSIYPAGAAGIKASGGSLVLLLLLILLGWQVFGAPLHH